jgi:agmatine deiminase
MAWPRRPDNWRERAGPAQRAFAAVAEAIHVSDPVTMAVCDADYEAARAALSPSIRVVELSCDDAWMRDIGPTFVIDDRGNRRGVDWRFNAWGGLQGGLYEPWDRDERAARKVLEIEAADRYRAALVLEGGSVHVDGEGTILSTEECLLHPNRNPDMTRGQIERALFEHLGGERMIWLGRGVFGDETDGHVDNLACFARPGLVLLSFSDDPADPQHAISHDALRRLRDAHDARGRRPEVALLPVPGPLTVTAQEAAGVASLPGSKPRRAGERMAGSYANFYLGNTRVVYPLLDARHDAAAAEVLAECFPDREIVGVATREILLGGGNIHCITQQVPAAGRHDSDG